MAAEAGSKKSSFFPHFPISEPKQQRRSLLPSGDNIYPASGRTINKAFESIF
jgi:hypothetical protein